MRAARESDGGLTSLGAASVIADPLAVPAGLITPARVDDVVLPGTADRIRSGVPRNTQRSYDTAWRIFADWCAQHGRTPLPASPATLADYAAHLCDLGSAPATIEHRIAVVHKKHRLAGYPKGTPDAEAARLVLRGHRRDHAASGQRAKEAPPITRERLRAMSAACDPRTLVGRRDRLLLVLGWALAARRSELAVLRIEDVTAGDGELDVLIRASKTDHDCVGQTVNVPAGEHVDTDPVGLLADWLEALAERGEDPTAGPLLRGVTKGDRLFRTRTVRRVDGVIVTFGALSGDAVDDIVKRCARQAGLPSPSQYSAHSLRAGFATQAANDGVPMAHFARHGRWSPTSPVPAGYVRTADRRRDNPLRKMRL